MVRVRYCVILYIMSVKVLIMIVVQEMCVCVCVQPYGSDRLFKMTCNLNGKSVTFKAKASASEFLCKTA